MELGFGVPVSGSWATPGNQVRLVRRAEELGYRTAWTFQRLLVPVRPEGVAAGEMYRSVLDPIVTLACLAGQTSTIRLGVAVVNMPFYAPAVLAKQLATLDVLSGGRLDAGLGLGWLPEELRAVGVPARERGARAEEFLRALRRLLDDEVVEFHGRFYDIPPARMEPKPVQRPHPPLLLGGGAEAALRRAGRLADGWVSGSRFDLARLGGMIGTIRQAAADAGRDPDALRYVARGSVRLRPGGAAGRPPLMGSVEEIRGDLDRLRDQGVTETFLDLNFDPEVGSPDADPAESLRRAHAVLEGLAPS